MKKIHEDLLTSLQPLSQIFGRTASKFYLDVCTKQKNNPIEYSDHINYTALLKLVTDPSQSKALRYKTNDKRIIYKCLVREYTKLHLHNYNRLLKFQRKSLLRIMNQYISLVKVDGNIVSLPIIRFPK